MEKFEVIAATSDDAELLADLLTDATRRKVKYGDLSWGTEEWTADETRQLLGKGSVHLAYLDRHHAGTIDVQLDKDAIWADRAGESVYVHRVAVKQEYAGHNLGGLMLDWAAQHAASLNREYVRLDCNSADAGLCSYYEHQGFKRVGTVATNNPKYFAALFERPVAS